MTGGEVPIDTYARVSSFERNTAETQELTTKLTVQHDSELR
jgi:hypothetical protein